MLNTTAKKLFAGFALLTFTAVLTGSWHAGTTLVQAEHHRIGTVPAEFNAQDVIFDSEPGVPIHGWFHRGESHHGAILLVHGIRASRRMMIPRAKFLQSLGFSLLLIDLRAHGESGGDIITLGLHEANDVEAGLQFLRREVPGEKLGIIGVSLGGAAALLAPQPMGVDAVVLESVFPAIDQAVENRVRMRLGWVAPLAKYLLLWQIPARLHVFPSAIRPVDHIAQLGAPVFILAGADDVHTTLPESQQLCDAAVAPKECWWIPGAAHVDLHIFMGGEYERRVGGFLTGQLQSVAHGEPQT